MVTLQSSQYNFFTQSVLIVVAFNLHYYDWVGSNEEILDIKIYCSPHPVNDLLKTISP